MTRIGNDNLLMAYSHVAHDCRLGDQIVLANCATLGGHVEIGDWVIMGGLSAVHQYTKVGAHCFIAHNAAVTRDVPPYIMAVGRPAVPHSVNSEGLKRRGFTAAADPQHPARLSIAVSLGVETRRRRSRSSSKAADDPGGDPALRRVHQTQLAQHRSLGGMTVPLRVGLVAGEASGDTLGAGLIQALRRLAPDAQFFGVAGPKMRAAGCEVWEPAESLRRHGAVRGPARSAAPAAAAGALRAHLHRGAPGRVRRDRCAGYAICASRDSLHAAGIPTVQYVSPQVWAWRQSRVRSIHESVDLVLCLLPFEKRFYDDQRNRRRVRRAPAGRCDSARGRPSRRARVRWGWPQTRKSSRCCPAAGAAR